MRIALCFLLRVVVPGLAIAGWIGMQPAAAATLPVVGSGSVLVHLKADAANVTLGGGNLVSQWTDVSGLSNSFTQGDSGQQPVWVDGVLNSHPVVRFDGNSDWLAAATAALNTNNRGPFTFFAVTNNTSDPFSLFDSAPSQVNTFRFGTGFPLGHNAVEIWNASPTLALGVNAAGSVLSVAAYRDGGSNRVLDVREVSTSGIFTPAPATGNADPIFFGNGGLHPTLGSVNRGGFGGGYYSGDVAEVLLYDGQLNSADRLAVETYLRDEYAINPAPPPPPPPPAVPSALGNYGHTVLASQPVALWRLETNDVPPADSADAPGFPQHGPQNGVYQNISPFNLAQPGPRPSDSIGGRPLTGFAADNKAVDFQGDGDGGDDVALFADDGNLNLAPGGAFTLEAWVKGAPVQGIGAPIFAKGDGAAEQFAVDLVGNQYRFYVRDGANPGVPSVLQTSVGPDGTWQHVVAVFDAAEGLMKLYVNGQEAPGTPNPGPPPTIIDNLHDISVGARQSANAGYDFNFDGLIDEVAVYAYGLGQAEVIAHYEAAFVPEPSAAMLVLAGCAVVLTARFARRRPRLETNRELT